MEGKSFPKMMSELNTEERRRNGKPRTQCMDGVIGSMISKDPDERRHKEPRIMAEENFFWHE